MSMGISSPCDGRLRDVPKNIMHSRVYATTGSRNVLIQFAAEIVERRAHPMCEDFVRLQACIHGDGFT